MCIRVVYCINLGVLVGFLSGWNGCCMSLCICCFGDVNVVG